MEMNKNTETIDDKCRDVLNYLYPNNETEMSYLQNKNSINSLKSIVSVFLFISIVLMLLKF